MSEEIECQNHANCGDYCETPREIAMVLCEDCLDGYDMRERERIELKHLRASVPELVEVLEKIKEDTRRDDPLNHYDMVCRALASYRAAQPAKGGAS